MVDSNTPMLMICEFHVSRRARDRYGFDLALFGSNGNVVFADFRAARLFADRMNRVRRPEQAVKASEINAMGLIDELLHAVVAKYRETVKPSLFGDTLSELEEDLGADVVGRVLEIFTEEFPPIAVYRSELGVRDYLAAETGGRPNREIAIEELVLLRLANTNPAFAHFRELFDDSRLRRDSAYDECIEKIESSLAARPGLG